MSPVRKMVYLMLSMAAMLFFPWLGGYVRFEGNFPSGFFAFPQLEPLPKPGFDLLMFCFVALVCTAIAVLNHA